MTIRPLRDLITVRLHAGVGMYGGFYIPDVTKSHKNQTFVRATVVAVGGEVKTVKALGTVVVSELFGFENQVSDGDGGMLRIGRERDIVGVIAEGACAPIEPVGDRVLLTLVGQREMDGGLYVPEKRKGPIEAEVVMAGPDSALLSGDRVMLPCGQGHALHVRFEDRHYLLANESTLLCSLDEPETSFHD